MRKHVDLRLIERQKVKKCFTFTGLFAPYPSDQGLYPWTLLRL